MKTDFLIGADVSSLQAMEDYGAKYYDFDGEEKDALELLKIHGVNCIRLRVWNEPETSFDRGDYCSLENTIAMAKRVKALGIKLLLDFHYSDSWADWQNQRVPKAWQGQSMEELSESVYQYTRRVLETLYNEGAYPEVVQIGNEIGFGLLWEQGKLDKPENVAALLNRGIDAVKEADTGSERAEIMLHVESGGNMEKTENFFTVLNENGLKQYDMIGLSYYPYWAGAYPNLLRNMQNIRKKFDKKVVVVETAFPYTDASHDTTPNVVTGELTRKEMGLEPSEENQRKVTEEIIQLVHNEENGYGVFYWEPVWYCVKGVGAMKDSGNEWENQAVFDDKGRALNGLHAFEILSKEV